MTRHHHQSKAEQIYNKAHGAAPFHHEKTHYEKNNFNRPDSIHDKTAVNKNAIQLQIYDTDQ